MTSNRAHHSIRSIADHAQSLRRPGKWPVSPNTPENVATQLARSRQLFVDGYYTYENFYHAATHSLQAVEAALRVRFDAGSKVSFAKLIDRAKAEGLVNDYTHDILHTGRELRNRQIHATTLPVFNPANRCQDHRGAASAGS